MLENFYKNVFTEIFRINKSRYDLYALGKPSINRVVVSDLEVFFVDNQDLTGDKTRALHIMLDLVSQ